MVAGAGWSGWMLRRWAVWSWCRRLPPVRRVISRRVRAACSSSQARFLGPNCCDVFIERAAEHSPHLGLRPAVGVHEEHHGALLRRQRVERREQFGFHVGHLVGDRPPELRGHRRCGEASYRTLPDPVQKLRFSAGRYTSCMARRFPTALATWEMWDRLDVTTASLRRSAPSATATSTVSTSPLRAIMSPT